MFFYFKKISTKFTQKPSFTYIFNNLFWYECIHGIFSSMFVIYCTICVLLTFGRPCAFQNKQMSRNFIIRYLSNWKSNQSGEFKCSSNKKVLFFVNSIQILNQKTTETWTFFYYLKEEHIIFNDLNSKYWIYVSFEWKKNDSDSNSERYS